jgi:hypothetical protein
MLHQRMDQSSKLHTGSLQCVFEVLNAFFAGRTIIARSAVPSRAAATPTKETGES